MAVVSVPEVQQWVDATKLTVTSVDAELEATAKEIVFTRLSRTYDTSTWVDTTTTPRLVRKIIAMLIASYLYDRQYSEDSEEGSWYAKNLGLRATTLIDNIVNDLVDIPDADPVGGEETGTPGFYPTDTTGAAPTYDAQGNQIAIAGGEDIKFHMGAAF